MAASLILPLGIFFNVAPYAILCIYPFRHRLRIPLYALISMLIVLFTTEFLIYLTVRNMPYFVEQVIFFFYLAAYLAVYVWSIRLDIHKLIFIFLVNADYASVIIGLSNFLEINLFPRCLRVGGYSVPLVLINLGFFFITVPAIVYIVTRKIIPLLDIENFRGWRMLWVISLMYLLTAITFSGADTKNLVSSMQYIVITVTMSIAGYVVLFIITEMLIRTNESANLREKTKMMEILLDFQKREYEKMDRQIAESRAARHDLRHHLSIVDTYLREEKYDELCVYIDEYKSTLPKIGGPPVSENYAVNAILQYYAELARMENIEIRIQVEIPRKSDYVDSDLCIVFGNCLENAIEACRRMKHGSRYIRVNAKIHGGILGIAVDNSFDGIVKMRDGKILSKKRVDEEGIGLSSIRAIAEKYSGKANFTYDTCEFWASVLLNKKSLNDTAPEATVLAKQS